MILDFVNNVYMCFGFIYLKIMGLVSLLRLNIKYCNVLYCLYMLYLICDSIINTYLLTYLLTGIF